MNTPFAPQAPAAAVQGIAALPQAPGQPQVGAAMPAQPQRQAPPQQIQDISEQLKMLLAANEKLEAAKRQAVVSQPVQPPVAQQVAQSLGQLNGQMQQTLAASPQTRAAQGGMIARGGVDRLPSNIKMASGGIVGFDEGGMALGDVTGEVERLLGVLSSNIASWRDKEQAKQALERMDIAQGPTAKRTRNMDVNDFKAQQTPTAPETATTPPPAVTAAVKAAVKNRSTRDADSRAASAETIDGVRDPGAAVYEKLRLYVASSQNPDADAVKTVNAFASKYGGADGVQGIAAIPGAAPKVPPAKAAPGVSDITTYAEKKARELGDTDVDAMRDKDAEYVKQNSGLPTILAAQRKRAEEEKAALAKAQEKDPNQLINALGAAGRANRGFRTESPLATLLGDFGAARRDVSAADKKASEDAYAKLVEMNNRINTVDDRELRGNAAVTDAGMKGADRARAQQQTGASAAASLANTRESIIDRQQRADQHMEVLREQIAARKQAAAQGNKTEAALAKARIQETMKALNGELVALINAGSKGLLEEADKQRILDLRKEVDGYRRALGDAVPEFKGQTGSTMSTDRASQFKVIR